MLRTRAHFERFAGERVRLEMMQPIDGRKRFSRRAGVGARGHHARAGERQVSLPIDDIHKARLAPDMSGVRTMNKEILMVVDAVSNEKGVDKEIIFEALEAALASATRKRHGEDIDVRVAINRKTGDYDTFRRWKVFADDSTELEFPERELRLEDALDVDKEGRGRRLRRGADGVGRLRPHRRADRPSRSSCRRCARPSARRSSTPTRSRVGQLVSGIVKRVDRNGIYVDLGGNAEGFVPRDRDDSARAGAPQDRIKAFLKDVRSEPRGPQLFLSRTAPSS